MALSRKRLKKVFKTRRRYKIIKKNRKYTKKMRGGNDEQIKKDMLECIRSYPKYKEFMENYSDEKKIKNNDIIDFLHDFGELYRKGGDIFYFRLICGDPKDKIYIWIRYYVSKDQIIISGNYNINDNDSWIELVSWD